MMSQDITPNSMNNTTEQNDLGIIRVPAQVYPYSAGISGGFIAGLAMVPVALIYGLISGHGIWYPVNMIAATLIRSWQGASVAQLEQFHLIGLLLGILLHILVSVILGLIFAVLLPTLPGTPILWAFIVSPILWVGATFAGLPLFNPIMAQYIDWLSFAIANFVYSLVIGFWVARIPKISVK